MTKLLLIGDLHGKWQSYAKLLEMYQPDRSIQVGDFGWGFAADDSLSVKDVELNMEDLYGEHRYFRGNHDNPAKCHAHKFCLDDLHWEPEIGLQVIAGAHSIDKAWRTPGIDWWEDEELSYDELDRAITLYEERKPSIVLTHDGPEDIIPYMFPWYRKDFPSRTRNALGNMLSLHKPDLWVFGHWHTSHTYHQDGTTFRCLAELEGWQIEV